MLESLAKDIRNKASCRLWLWLDGALKRDSPYLCRCIRPMFESVLF